MSDDQRTLAAWIELFDRLTTGPITQPVRVPIHYQGQQVPKLGLYLHLRNEEALALEKLSAKVATVVARSGQTDEANLLFLMSSKIRAGNDGVAVFPRVKADEPMKAWAAVKSLAAAETPPVSTELIPPKPPQASREKLFPNGLPADQNLVDCVILLDTKRDGKNPDMVWLLEFFGDDERQALLMQAEIARARSEGVTTLAPNPKRYKRS